EGRAAFILPGIEADRVHSTLEAAGVGALYPGFREWFWGKVVPGIATGERFCTGAIVNERLVGIAIGKRTTAESKLCTLWTSPEVRGNRVATRLARDAFQRLETDRPLFTVQEERIAEFDGLLQGWKF